MNDTSMHARKKSAYAGRQRDIVADVDIDIDGSGTGTAAVETENRKRFRQNSPESSSFFMNVLPAMNSLKRVSL